MSVIDCKEPGCNHEVVYLKASVIGLVGIASAKDSKKKVSENVENVGREYCLTLECIATHRHNYKITFEQ